MKRIYVKFPNVSYLHSVSEKNRINLGDELRKFCKLKKIAVRDNLTVRETWFRQMNEGHDTNQIEGLLGIEEAFIIGERIAVPESGGKIEFIGKDNDNDRYYEYNDQTYLAIYQLLVGPRDWKYCSDYMEAFIAFLKEKGYGCDVIPTVIEMKEDEEARKRMKGMKETAKEEIKSFLKGQEETFRNYRILREPSLIARTIRERYIDIWHDKEENFFRWKDLEIYLKVKTIKKVAKKLLPIVKIFPVEKLPAENYISSKTLNEIIEKDPYALGEPEDLMRNSDAAHFFSTLVWLGVLSQEEEEIPLPRERGTLKIKYFRVKS